METLQVVESERVAEDVLQYFTFHAGKELYGIPVEAVKEVIVYCKVLQIPRTPDYIKGVINLRGEILPVIDLSYLFYGRKSEILPSSGIVFIEVNYKDSVMVVGMIIDAVEAVQDILSHEIDAAPEFGEKIRPDYIKGIGKAEGWFVIILDIASVLNIEELSRFNGK